MTIEKEQLSSLLHGLSATLKTAKDVRKVYDKELALDFNPIMSFWRIGENKLSQILAFFLDPSQSHGQETLFLDSFLATFFSGVELPKYNHLYIQCEYPTPAGRRLDMYLDFDKGAFGIGIENKLWAKDQPRQLKDYSDHLHQKHKGNYCLLYLTPYNQPPNEISLSKEELQELKHSGKYFSNDHSTGISKMLEEWIKICQAEKVRIFLKNLHQYIQHEVNGETFMGQNELVANYVTQNSTMLEAALAIGAANYQIKQNLLDQVKQQIVEIGVELNLTGDVELVNQDKDYPGFYFYHVNLTERNICIGFEFAGKWGKEMYYGLCSYNNKDIDDKIMRELQSLNNSDYKPSGKGWAAFKYFDINEYRNWGGQEYISITNGDFKRTIKTKVEELIQAMAMIGGGYDLSK